MICHFLIVIALPGVWSCTLVLVTTIYKTTPQGRFLSNLFPRQHHCRDMGNILRCCLDNRSYNYFTIVLLTTSVLSFYIPYMRCMHKFSQILCDTERTYKGYWQKWCTQKIVVFDPSRFLPSRLSQFLNNPPIPTLSPPPIPLSPRLLISPSWVGRLPQVSWSHTEEEGQEGTTIHHAASAPPTRAAMSGSTWWQVWCKSIYKKHSCKRDSKFASKWGCWKLHVRPENDQGFKI